MSNATPVADDQDVTIGFNQKKGITLTATDDEPLLFTVVTRPAHGVLSGLAPDLVYVPDTNYSGVDSFIYSVSDGKDGTDTATVTITVNGPIEANHSPEAGDDTVTTKQELAVSINVTANDADPDGDALVDYRRSAAATWHSVGGKRSNHLHAKHRLYRVG